MKITLESTAKIVSLDGIPARVWEGKTASGIAVHAYVTRIAVARDADCSQFESELQEHRAPSPEVAAIPARLVL
jgi:hypothetical protein